MAAGLFGAPIPVQPGQWYVASYHTPDRSVRRDRRRTGERRGPAAAAGARPRRRPAATASTAMATGASPTGSYADSNYFVDVLFTDLAAPILTGRVPEAGTLGVSTSTTLEVTFSEPIAGGSVQAELRDGARRHRAGDGRTRSRVGRRRRSGRRGRWPSATTYTASVLAATDLAGNPMAPRRPGRSRPSTRRCRRSSATRCRRRRRPTIRRSSKLGMKFQVTQNAQVEGIRYYRGPGNDGTHVGHLWDSGGRTARRGRPSAASPPAAGSTHRCPQPLVLVPAPSTWCRTSRQPAGTPCSGATSTPGRSRPARSSAWRTSPGTATASTAYGGGFPTGTYGGGNYWVDVVVRTT